MIINRKLTRIFLISGIVLLTISCNDPKPALVFQTDFGVKDGAVNAMKGVARTVDNQLDLFDLTHEIPAYNIWEAAYRLEQSAAYWPKGTVFVSVVDPGVGTTRRSIVLRSKMGQYFVTPDNGTLTLIAASQGIDAIRKIDETKNRRAGSSASYTFHGRDVYAYTAARLASGKISFEEVGDLLPSDSLIRIDFQSAMIESDAIKGNIPILDIQYGNVWTNIPDSLLKLKDIKLGDYLNIRIFEKDSLRYDGILLFANTFGDVPVAQPLCYLNSLLNLSFAVNEGDFSALNSIKSGPEWTVIAKKTGNK